MGTCTVKKKQHQPDFDLSHHDQWEDNSMANIVSKFHPFQHTYVLFWQRGNHEPSTESKAPTSESSAFIMTGLAQ